MRMTLLVSWLLIASCAQSTDAADKTGSAGSGGATGVLSGSAGSNGGGSTGSGVGGALSTGGAFTAVNCDKASTITTMTTYTSGTTTTSASSSTTTYYADIAVAGLNPAAPPSVRVVLCVADRTTYVPTPAGYTSTISHSGDPDPNGQPTCYETSALFAAGHVYVNCGYTAFDSSGAMTSSVRNSKAYISM